MAHTHAKPDLPSLIQRCRERGLRKTYLLERVLEFLLRAERPLSIQEIQNSSEIIDACDPATVYRLLARLEEKGLVRRLGLHERAAHYILNSPESHHDYVICLGCGDVQTLHLDCPVEPLEQEVSEETGFSDLYHELQFYGRCPDCNRGHAASRT